jgi:hypothetical protein
MKGDKILTEGPLVPDDLVETFIFRGEVRGRVCPPKALNIPAVFFPKKFTGGGWVET